MTDPVQGLGSAGAEEGPREGGHCQPRAAPRTADCAPGPSSLGGRPCCMGAVKLQAKDFWSAKLVLYHLVNPLSAMTEIPLQLVTTAHQLVNWLTSNHYNLLAWGVSLGNFLKCKNTSINLNYESIRKSRNSAIYISPYT